MKRLFQISIIISLMLLLCACAPAVQEEAPVPTHPQPSLSVDPDLDIPEAGQIIPDVQYQPSDILQTMPPTEEVPAPTLSGTYIFPPSDAAQADEAPVIELLSFDAETVTWEDPLSGDTKTGTYTIAGDALELHFDTMVVLDADSGETERTMIDEEAIFRIRSEDELVSAAGGDVFRK